MKLSGVFLGCDWIELVGDGYCNDESNNRHCNFDGGDCCYKCVSTLFCLECECLTGNAGQEINHHIHNQKLTFRKKMLIVLEEFYRKTQSWKIRT